MVMSMDKRIPIIIGSITAVAIFVILSGEGFLTMPSIENISEEENTSTSSGSLGLLIQSLSVNKKDNDTSSIQISFRLHNPTSAMMALKVLQYDILVNDTTVISGDLVNDTASKTVGKDVTTVLGNSILTLTDSKTIRRNNFDSNMWDEITSGKAAYLIKGTYVYRNEDFQTKIEKKDFELTYLGNTANNSTTLQKIQTIHLVNVNGRIDHMDVDVDGGRLFVAELGNHSVDIIDLMNGKIIHRITGLDEPQGILFVPDVKKIYVANAGDGTVEVFNSDSYALVKTINLSSDADNMRYDSDQKLVYVGYGNGALGLINTVTDSLIGNIKLGGHPESFQISYKLSPGIFVNVPGDDSIEVVDGQKRMAVAKMSNTDAHSNYAMALDEDNHRLFVVYRQPSQLYVLSADTGNPVAKLNVVGDADDIFYDNKNNQIYVTGGDGYLQVISQDDANAYHEAAKIPTANGARTSLYVPETERLYVAAPSYFGQDAQIQVYEIHKLH